MTGLKRGDGLILKIVVYDQYSDFSISNPAGFNAYKEGIPRQTEIVGAAAYPETKK